LRAAARCLRRCAIARAIVLASDAGELNNTIAERLELTKATVGKWRTRFIERRIAGLYDDVRPGKPRTIHRVPVAAAKCPKSPGDAWLRPPRMRSGLPVPRAA